MSKTIMPAQLMLLMALLLLATSSPAFAYIGPGAGISVLGSLLSILATIVVAIGAILFWPLRKFLKRRKARRASLAGIDDVSKSVATKSVAAAQKSDDISDEGSGDENTGDENTRAGS